MKLLIPLLFISIAPFLSVDTYSQGCVAIRPMGASSGNYASQLGALPKGQWQFSATYQYFKSFRHFRGDVQEHERIELGTQVENISHSVDFGFQKALTDKLSLGLNVPVLYYDRSSLYEHYGNSLTSNPDQMRFHTGSFGIGDTRITANYWLLDPKRDSLKGNIAVGLGVKLPTGNSNVQGDFHKISDSGSDSIATRAVDQSIQLGDGGFGIIFTLQGVKRVFNHGMAYFNGFYMASPQETNKTLTRGTTVGVDPIAAYHSIPDQYALRMGILYNVMPASGFSTSLGFRFEGVTAKDLIGSSNGFRRPGYILSVDPGIVFSRNNLNINVNVPVALYRNRIKSVQDLADPTGKKHGDAAFADYLVSVGIAYRFGKTKLGANPITVN